MIELGKSLRNAREAKGYTPSQIAEMTHLKTSIVEQLENEDFSSIAAPIYGRGFVKLYCEAVGLEPKPHVDEFMAIINGNREIVIRERPVAEPVAPVPPMPETPAVPPAEPEPDLFGRDAVPPPEADAVPPAAKPIEPAMPAAEPEQPFSRFAAPIRERAPADVFSFVNPRILILAGCAFALLVAILFGIRGLYRATAPASAADAQTDAQPVAKAPAAKPETTPASKPAVREQPQKIPSLYID